MKYGIALKRKEFISGLNKSDAMQLFDYLNEEEAFPIEFDAIDAECCVIGFIAKKAASSLDYDYKHSGLKEFLQLQIDSMADADKADNMNTSRFRGINILII